MQTGSSKPGPRTAPAIRPAVGRLARLIFLRRDAILIAAVIVISALAARSIWLHMRERVFENAQYQLTLDNIEITPPPSWIHCNVKAEALRDGSLDEPLSLVDDDLAERIAKAFALHPWVANVKSVTKRFPAGAAVELVYRRPVAMVEVPDGLFPVDATGTLLPSGDFSAAEARAYPRIAGTAGHPLGPVGTSWNDSTVIGAAQIAAALLPVWSDLRLYQIRFSPHSPQGNPIARGHFQLVTRIGSVIPWGSPPGGEMPGEPGTDDKIAKLKHYAAEHGNLDTPASTSELDLRAHASPPTAQRSKSLL